MQIYAMCKDIRSKGRFFITQPRHGLLYVISDIRSVTGIPAFVYVEDLLRLRSW